MRVSQSVQRGVWDTGLFHAPADHLRNEVGREISAVWTAENQIVSLVSVAAQLAMFVDLGLPKLEGGGLLRLADPEAARLSALRCLYPKAARTRFFKRLSNIQSRIEPVNLGPRERQQFASARASC